MTRLGAFSSSRSALTTCPSWNLTRSFCRDHVGFRDIDDYMLWEDRGAGEIHADEVMGAFVGAACQHLGMGVRSGNAGR